MKKSVFITLVLTGLVLFYGCTKEGEIGPEGPQGLQGETGPAGDDGSLIYAGTGAPDSEIGVTGDYYLDKSTGELYGPKHAEGGWGVPIMLTGEKGDKGDDGLNGDNGSQIYAGTDAPASGTGVDGDYYLNTVTYDLYGPKSADSWGTPINLKGTANVMYSAWIDANWNVTDATTSKGMTILVNQVTNNELRDECLIMVYLKQYGSSLIYPMPSTGRWSNTWYQYTFGGNTTGFDQRIYITLVSTNGVDLTEYQYTAFRGNRFRYVLIPGTVLNSKIPSSDENNYQPDLSIYNDVKKYFGIKDSD